MQQHWGGIFRISQCRCFCLAWVLYSDPRCEVRYCEEMVFPRLPLSPKSCVFLLELIYPLPHLLISLPCTLDVVEVVVADTTLEDVAHLVRDAIFLVDNWMCLIRDRGIVRTVIGITISLRSVGRSLVDPSGHSWFWSSCPMWYSNSFIYSSWFIWFFHCYTIIWGIWSTMSARVLSERSFSNSCIFFRYACLCCLSSRPLNFRFRSLIPHDRY